MKKISALGLDIGTKRIGVAACDGLGLFASGLTTIERKSFTQDVEKFKQIVTEREVQILIVGMPYSLDKTIGKQAQQVQEYALKLAEALNLPVKFMDESFTSYAAEELIKAQGRSPSRNKGMIDQKAAALILQDWLDQLIINN